jgi:hypothetical protein
VLLESPLSSFSWVRNLVVLGLGSQPETFDRFRETVPYLSALTRVKSLSLIYPPNFPNFDELLNLFCVFPSLQSVLLSGVRISDWTWSTSRPRLRPSLSSITLQEQTPGILLWLQPQKTFHAVRSFRGTIVDTEGFELMDSFLQPSAGTLQHLDITFGGDAYKCGKNYPQSFWYHQINSCAQN